MLNRREKTRIDQLTSTYGPDEPPRVSLDFGDFLSLLWRLDKHADEPGKVNYYRQCALALAEALGLKGRSVFRLITLTPPGQLYSQIPNAPYRGTHWLVDAQDRKAAITQMIQLRSDILRIGTYRNEWATGWPGNGIVDNELRERVFSIFFTGLQEQYGNLGRLLLVIDIVVAELLMGKPPMQELDLYHLILEHHYPNPTDAKIRQEYYGATSEEQRRRKAKEEA